MLEHNSSVALWLFVAGISSLAHAQRPPEPADGTSKPPVVAAKTPVSADPSKTSFRRDVAAILVKNCVACHGPDKAQGSYRLDTFERAKKPGDNELPPFVAGKPDESEWMRLLTSTDKAERMPKDGDPLPAHEIATIKKWIDEGAAFDGPDAAAPLASYLPRQPHPTPPEKYPVAVPVTALAFHPSGSELAVGGYHEVTIWNPTNGQLLRRLKNIAQRTHALQYNADGSLLAVAGGTPGRSGEAKLINPADGAEVRLLQTAADEIFDVQFSPDGKRLATAAADRSIRVFDVGDGKELRAIENHADWVMAVAWSGDGTKLASASRDKTSKVFEAATGNLLTTYSGHGEAVYGVAFAADGGTVFSSGRDKKVHQWKVADAGRAGEMGGFGGEVYKLLARDGQLFCASSDKSVRQFREKDRGQVRQYAGQQDWVFAVAWHPGTKRLASGGYNGRVVVWNTDDGKPVADFAAAPGFAGPTGK